MKQKQITKERYCELCIEDNSWGNDATGETPCETEGKCLLDNTAIPYDAPIWVPEDNA